MAEWLPDLLAFLALALITAGVALISLAAGLIVAGIGLALIAWRYGATQ